ICKVASGKDYDAASVQADFRQRYDSFLSVLRANNQGLEVMAEMEQALRGDRLFGMSFVRSRCVTALMAASEMVLGLSRLAPGKYPALEERLLDLRSSIEPRLILRGIHSEGPLVLKLSEAGRESADLVGGKMASLGELASALQVVVPDGFVVTSVGFDRFFEHNDLRQRILDRFQALALSDDSFPVESMKNLHRLSFELQQMVVEGEVPPDLAEAMFSAYEELKTRCGSSLRLAMRSSAVGEDFANISFAGQYRTELNVSAENMLLAYREVLASKYALTAMSYRLARGIPDEETPMCVGCLRMVDAARGGVMYTRNPLPEGEEEVLLSAVFGLPKGVVDGSAASDHFAVRREGPLTVVRAEIADKTHKYGMLDENGICRIQAGEAERHIPVLSDSQAVALAELGLTVEAFYDRPMDIEWAYDDTDGLVLLQCRPLSVPDVPVERAPFASGKSGKVLLSGGATASQGVAAGVVHVVSKEADMLSFPEGGVLVAPQSSPRLAPLLSKAAAIVCEQGSVTGHLANVAREFGVPAVFGADGALKALSSGSEVTVDADAHIVFAGRIEELLRRRVRPRNLMEGSTVLETLRQVSRRIVPLTLLDPESPAFRARNCDTVHDVARFCHEKVVHHMFRFSKHHNHPERSSKRLVTGSPMQWWVLNLDDGLEGEDRGKYVHLDDIVSIPMLALWDGITAVPWQGPPAMDGR
ncbi:MAG: pyruvate, water dikinase, partial [Proteobacteria bacterium]|nr:pyruvate, water dikinase [Pseudomonadota bacterium]